MIRTTINIGSHTFICDYFNKNEVDKQYKRKFVMLRPVVLDNGRIKSPEIFLVEKDIITDNIEIGSVFPVLNELEHYSSNINKFINNNQEYYSFYNNDLSEKIFDCDIIKVYHPLSKTKKINTIVHVYTIINDIKIHLFCKSYTDNQPCAQTEFTINNNIYSEYIELCIPNIKDLVSKNTYYTENIIPIYNAKDVMPTYLWLLDYKNITVDGNIFRQYIYEDINNLSYNYPINISLFPFDKIDNETFLLDETLNTNTDSFLYYDDITISSKLGFNSIGKLVLKADFEYSAKDKFNSVKDAYQFYKNVSFSDYLDIEYEQDDEHYDYDANNNLLTKQYQCAYILELASDTHFKNIIYRSNFVEGVTLFDDVDNREFDIPVFTKWEQLPEVLISRIIFIDRYLGIITESNFTVITKEYYKYLVRYTDKKIYMIDLQDMQDKFIENVKCIIKKNNTEQTVGLQANIPKIIYKPVFYKVQDLQNIQIRQGVTQNIGINLMNYLSKVEAFNLNLDGKKFIETARNDSFIIFKIQANTLNSTSGTYHICNQDDEYISSGQWTLY